MNAQVTLETEKQDDGSYAITTQADDAGFQQMPPVPMAGPANQFGAMLAGLAGIVGAWSV